MRKYDDWKELVYGGESGVEVTKGANGLHIHIHAMILVRKEKQSRNTLAKIVLHRWNNLTKGASKRKEFSIEEIAGIQKTGGKNGENISKEWIVGNLEPTGSTLVGLENLYKIKMAVYFMCRKWQGL